VEQAIVMKLVNLILKRKNLKKVRNHAVTVQLHDSRGRGGGGCSCDMYVITFLTPSFNKEEN
jgi:hypothetical protein